MPENEYLITTQQYTKFSALLFCINSSIDYAVFTLKKGYHLIYVKRICLSDPH